MSGLSEQFAYLAYSAGWALTKRVPHRLAFGTFARIADVAWRRRVTGVVRLEHNLARVRPEASAAELREMSRATMHSYFRYWCEMFRLAPMTEPEARDRVVVHEEHRLHEALARGRGVVCALPHMANYELAGAWACATGLSFTTVAQRLRPEKLFDRFVAYRNELGMEVLPLTGGEDRFGVLAERLRAGGLVCLVADRDLSENGVEVSFFGEPARMPPGPAALAVRTGATVLPVTLWYDGPRMHMRLEPEVTRAAADEPGAGRGAGHGAGRGGGQGVVARMTQRVADAFAAGIDEHPQDWHMLQRVWVKDLDSGGSGRGERHPSGSEVR